MDPTVVQFITVAGAAGALGWVLRLLTASKPGLHTASEVKGLKQDKVDLLVIVKSLTESLRASNETDSEILAIVKEVRDGTPR